MRRCTFEDFYEDCASRLTEQQLRALSPRAEYFRTDKGYCGLFLDPEKAWISILVGGMPDIWEFKELLARFDKVGFECRPGSPANVLARYYGADIEPDGHYPDGETALKCVIDTRQTRRLNKNGVKSQAIS